MTPPLIVNKTAANFVSSPVDDFYVEVQDEIKFRKIDKIAYNMMLSFPISEAFYKDGEIKFLINNKNYSTFDIKYFILSGYIYIMHKPSFVINNITFIYKKNDVGYISQKRTVVSPEPEASLEPSGLNATETIASVWPVILPEHRVTLSTRKIDCGMQRTSRHTSRLTSPTFSIVSSRSEFRISLSFRKNKNGVFVSLWTTALRTSCNCCGVIFTGTSIGGPNSFPSSALSWTRAVVILMGIL